MKNIITANDLKTKGVSILEKITSNGKEAIISVRGKNKYVVLTMEEYNHLREYELEAALSESQKDLSKGNYIMESVEDHIKRITGA
ncbi:MAG: prevent-host-death protein [Spirochaetota bacterium]